MIVGGFMVHKKLSNYNGKGLTYHIIVYTYYIYVYCIFDIYVYYMNPFKKFKRL